MYKKLMAGLVALACLFGTYLLVFSLPAKENTKEPAASVAVPEVAVDADAAMEIYQASCLSCHGDQLQGGYGPGLTNVGASMSKEQIYKQIAKGGGGMPKFEKKLTEDQLIQLTNWLAGMK